MTTPVGHPDFQDTVRWRGPVLASGAFTVTSSSFLFVSQYVTNFNSLLVNIDNVIGGVTVVIRFWTDSTETVQCAVSNYVLTTGTKLSMIIPIAGNFLDFSIRTAQAGNQTGTYVICPMNLPAAKNYYPQTSNVQSQQSLSVAASQVLTYTLPQVIEGNGYWFIDPADATGKLYFQLAELGENGAQAARLAGDITPATATTITFLSGAVPLQAYIRNNDAAAAHTVTFELRTLGP